MMSKADLFDKCLRVARWIVAEYRAQAPAGCDPVNDMSPSAPPARNLTKEMLQTLKGYTKTAGDYYALEKQYQPQYGLLSLQNQMQQLFGTPTQPGTLQMGARAATYTRGQDIADVAQYGPYATAAFLQANPFLAGSLTNLYGRTADSPILQTLNQQAAQALAQGGQLSPQDIRAADQAARAAFAARGLVGTSPAAAAEILNRDAAVRQRLAAAQQFASGVQGLNQQQADLVGRASQIFSTTLSDPFQAILGRPSGAAGTGGVAAGAPNYQQQIGVGARLFDPTNPYAADVYNTNYNAQAAANIAGANQQASLLGAGIGAVGGILGGLLSASDKRLKKDVKATGEKTPEGIPIKTFRFKTDPKKRKYRGVMAEDVAKVKPAAVVTDPVTGLKLVNYAKIRTPFQLLAA